MLDVVIIGGGIVGLSTAYHLLQARPDLKLTLLEKENQVAAHQTGHNSGVIHSGLYYTPGSLKAINCIRGYKMLIEFCDEEGIDYDLCGKIVVATQKEQLPLLQKLFDRGLQNGLSQNRMISREEMREIEPHVEGLAGIHVPYTGIINYRKVSQTLAGKIEALGGKLVLNQKVVQIRRNIQGTSEVVTETGQVFQTRLIVNCAGLYSDKIAQLTQSDPIKVRIIPFRGEYYQLKPEREFLVKNLIYPVPDPNFPFLGVHYTRMIEGGVEAGPNAVFAFKREGYKFSDVNFSETVESLSWPGFRQVIQKYWRTGLGEMYRSLSKNAFAKALQELIPEIAADDLIPGGAGVRAQACSSDGGLLDDFSIVENEIAVNVCNAPS
ncbi:MAG: L-2-hydroxyglutarate oxidase, partial [Spirosomataceae bacterium]